MRFATPTKHRQPWSPEDDATIIAKASTKPVSGIAMELGRSNAAVETRANVLKVKTFYRVPCGDSEA
jgi:hypothetical protein